MIRQKQGFVLIGVLIAIAIIMILMLMQMDHMGMPVRTPSRTIEEMPWTQEDSLVESGRPVKLPKAPKYTLSALLDCTIDLTMDQQPRGTLEMKFTTDGRLTGQWNCRIENENRLSTFHLSLEGNIDVSKTFSDENGKDKSLLFFIGKGNYTEEIENTQTFYRTTNQGIGYAIGWITPDGKTLGRVSLTQDKKSAFNYTWDERP